MGSCIEIDPFMAPVLVLVAPSMGQAQFQLVFTQVEMWMLFGAMLLGASSTTTDRSNGLRAYLIVAAIPYLTPIVFP
jgi:Ca2+:H+ antiporter